MYENIIPIPPPTGNQPFRITLAGISYCDGTYHINRKNSNIFCIEYIFSGTGTVICNNKRFYPSSGQGYILFPGDDQEYYSDSKTPWIKIWFNAEGDIINELAELYNIRDITVFENTDISYLIQKIHRIFSAKTYSPLYMHQKSAIIFHKIIQSLSAQYINHEIISDEAYIIRNYINSNITEKISVDQLAKLIFRSRSQTIRIFKASFGITPYDYILDKKIVLAKNLLKNTNLLIKEIAFKLSFSDEHYFSNVFRQKTGITPQKYRQQK